MKNKSFVIALLCLVGFCVVAVVFKVFPLFDLPASFVGAALGAVITGVITTILLKGQAQAEELKERNVKIFQKKSEIFQKYIGVVWDVWKDHKVTFEEFDKLTGLYYQELMLYMKEESSKIVGAQLKIVGGFAEKDSLSDKDKEELETALITVINTISTEISLGGQVDRALFINLDKSRTAAEEIRNRRQNRSFKTLGIKPQTELVLRTNPDIKCTTIDEKNKVSYEGKEYSLSGLATEVLNRPASGFAEFMLNGKILQDMG